jgi:asparagine synthetase B (glutamine-hydrolysing)
MCGFAGIFRPEALNGLRAMVDAKHQRGPGADGHALTNELV